MIRTLATLAFLALAPAAAAAPQAKPAIIAHGAQILLGDVFSDAGARAGEPVTAAPAPGARVTVNAAWLEAVAEAHGLDWTPRSRFDQAVVERATTVIAADTLASRLLPEIAQRTPLDDAELQLDNPGIRLVVPEEDAGSIGVDGLTVDSRNGRFSAFVSVPAGDPNAVRQRVGGRIIFRTEIVVPVRALSLGETIAPQDLKRIAVRRDRLGPDVLASAGDLVGMTPRRPLRADQPVRAADVEATHAIHRNDLVTIVLETPNLRLTAQGTALEDGKIGAPIRVANTQSKRVIDGVVAGPGLVAIPAPALSSPPLRTAALGAPAP